MIADKKLYRSKTNRVIAGVCGGLGDYFDVDPIIFRILFVALVFGQATGILLYIILWIIIPEEGEQESGKLDKERFEKLGREASQSADHMAKEIKQKTGSSENLRNIIGIIVIAIGFLALANQLFHIQFFQSHIFWPVVIVVLGLLILFKKNDT